MSEHKWRVIPARDRRVLGVLIEKAKTTPDVYPMTLNALLAGCNQKSNRFPQMELEDQQVEEVLDRLKGIGAVVEVQGSSRVARFKHLSYEWLGVDKVELAVMAELLLRGAQTEGELRGRASRMEPIADLGALRTVLDSLKAKGLVLSLSPAGRGHVVTHALYEDRELDKVKADYRAMAANADDGDDEPASPPAPRAAAPAASAAVVTTRDSASSSEVANLKAELADLKEEFAKLRKDVDDLWSNLR